MNRFVRPLVLGLCAVLVIVVYQRGGSEPARAEDPKPKEETKVSFSKDIQPLLVEKCGNCHGTVKPKKGIDYVTSYDTTMKTVKADKPDESRMYRSVSGKGKQMPPKKPLAAEDIAKIKAWIADGAKDN